MPKIILDKSLCVRCGLCALVCPGRILRHQTSKDYPVCVKGAEENCIACHHCVSACPVGGLTVNGISHNDCLEYDKTAVIRFEQIAHLVRKRRSIRHYSSQPLESRVIEQLLDVVRWAPTAKNGLPVKWVIVNNASKVKELAGLVMAWVKKQPNTKQIVENWKNGGDPIFRGAPCVIGAYADDTTAMWATVDTAIAVETLDLCATAMRLGTCWAGFFTHAAQSSEKNTINKWLGLSKTETIHGGLMIGHIGKEIYQRIPHRPEAPKIWIR